MRNSFLKAALIGTVLSGFAVSATAGNSAVENALRSDPSLSMFYRGLVSTGVINELKENQSYTVFAPTNDAFAQLPVDKYPCFYSEACKPEVAEVLRNHIVPGEKQLGDIGMSTHSSGTMSMFSLNDYHMIGSEPFKGTYAVDGRKVLSREKGCRTVFSIALRRAGHRPGNSPVVSRPP